MILLLVFVFGVVIGSYACSTGNSGDLTTYVENDAGAGLDNVGVTVTNESGDEVANGTTDQNGVTVWNSTGDGTVSLDNGEYNVTATLGNGNSVVSNSTNVTIDGSNEQTTIVLPGFDGQDPFKLVE